MQAVSVTGRLLRLPHISALCVLANTAANGVAPPSFYIEAGGESRPSFPSPFLSCPLPPAALDIKPSSSFPLSPSLSPLYHNSLSPCYQLGLSRPMAASRPGPSLMPPCESREKMGGGGEKGKLYSGPNCPLTRMEEMLRPMVWSALSPPLSASAGRACYSSFGSRGFATLRTSTRWSALCESAVVGES